MLPFLISVPILVLITFVNGSIILSVLDFHLIQANKILLKELLKSRKRLAITRYVRPIHVILIPQVDVAFFSSVPVDPKEIVSDAFHQAHGKLQKDITTLYSQGMDEIQRENYLLDMILQLPKAHKDPTLSQHITAPNVDSVPRELFHVLPTFFEQKISSEELVRISKLVKSYICSSNYSTTQFMRQISSKARSVSAQLPLFIQKYKQFVSLQNYFMGSPIFCIVSQKMNSLQEVQVKFSRQYEMFVKMMIPLDGSSSPTRQAILAAQVCAISLLLNTMAGKHDEEFYKVSEKFIEKVLPWRIREIKDCINCLES